MIYRLKRKSYFSIWDSFVILDMESIICCKVIGAFQDCLTRWWCPFSSNLGFCFTQVNEKIYSGSLSKRWDKGVSKSGQHWSPFCAHNSSLINHISTPGLSYLGWIVIPPPFYDGIWLLQVWQRWRLFQKLFVLNQLPETSARPMALFRWANQNATSRKKKNWVIFTSPLLYFS